jgi:hypothetical protein
MVDTETMMGIYAHEMAIKDHQLREYASLLGKYRKALEEISHGGWATASGYEIGMTPSCFKNKAKLILALPTEPVKESTDVK